MNQNLNSSIQFSSSHCSLETIGYLNFEEFFEGDCQSPSTVSEHSEENIFLKQKGEGRENKGEKGNYLQSRCIWTKLILGNISKSVFKK